MKTRDPIYRLIYSLQRSFGSSESVSLDDALAPQGLVSKFLQEESMPFEFFSLAFQTEPAVKYGYQFYIPDKTKLLDTLTQIINELPVQEKVLFSLYYCDKLNFREIGEVLGYSEQEVIRIFSNGMKKVADRIIVKAGN